MHRASRWIMYVTSLPRSPYLLGPARLTRLLLLRASRVDMIVSSRRILSWPLTVKIALGWEVSNQATAILYRTIGVRFD
jgi:hypothetical protein